MIHKNLQLSRAAANNFSISFFLVLVLFIPNTDALARFYFAAVLLAIPVLLINTGKLYFDYLTLIGVGTLVLHTIFTVLRFGFVVDPNLRDYTEFARILLPVLMLMFRDKFKDLTTRTLFIVFGTYVSIDFLISVLDFINIDFGGIIAFTKSTYVSSGHSDIDFRICGLSAGPAQHGIKMLVLYTFFYCRIFQSKRVALPIILSFISAFPIFLTQSRTSVVAFAMVSLGVSIYYVLFGKKEIKKRSFLILSILIFGGGYVLIRFRNFFSRILELLNGIAGISSYQDRVQSYSAMFDKAMDHPAFLAIGYGKNFFQMGAFDNEYLLMFFVFGPIISSIIIFSVVTYITVFLLKKRKTDYEYGTILFFLFLAGLVIAYPATFFLQTSIIPLLFIFINLVYWENIRLKKL